MPASDCSVARNFADEIKTKIQVQSTHWSMVTHRLRNERTGFVF